MDSPSPYAGLSVSEWLRVTEDMVDRHPLSSTEIVDTVLASWQSIFDSRLGTKGFRIGQEIFPKPQIMGFLLHELISLELAAKHPDTWRGDTGGVDKDLVYIPDNFFSVEVKTSSDPKHIYGNRSYAQKTTKMKKSKSGYYLAVNFEKFSGITKPGIQLIRFGWIDAADWIGQKAASGQQSRLSHQVEKYKLIQLYKKN